MKAPFLELNVSEPDAVLDKLAVALGTICENGYLKIPDDKGKGYLRGIVINEAMSIMIRDCEFNEDLRIKRNFSQNPQERILLSFNNVLYSGNSPVRQATFREMPQVQIVKGNLNLEMFYPSHTNFKSVLLAIRATDLKQLLDLQTAPALLQNILESNSPVLFEEIIPGRIQRVALEIADNNLPPSFQHFFYRIKAEELLCLTFAAFLQRETANVYALNEQDATGIYRVRDKILASLQVSPVLDDLALEAGMSRSKLKRLFKQIFGESIFNYYQAFRMREAARLLKEHKLSVSEVGYRMGFENLSHFTRTFEKHLGMKPKKFSLG